MKKAIIVNINKRTLSSVLNLIVSGFMCIGP